MQAEKTSLYFKDNRSDKEYHTQLVPQGDGWMIFYQNGKRGGTLTNESKYDTPVEYSVAKKEYDRKVKEKLKKGYSTGEEGTAYVGTSLEERVSGLLPQLLNPVKPGQVDALTADDDWVAQEKHDGHRRLVRAEGDTIEGINRKGLITGLPAPVFDDIASLGDNASKGLAVDGELVGDYLMVFDVLTFNGGSVQDKPYSERLELLAQIEQKLKAAGRTNVQVVQTARTPEEKRALRARLKESKREGIVFKRLDAVYEAGCPNSGGAQLKDKFTYMASVRVKAAHATKRSVAMEVLSANGEWVGVGNCTVPSGKDVPKKGDILEVQYLYAFEGGSIFQPQFKFVRDDIEESACAQSQLIYKPADIEDEEES